MMTATIRTIATGEITPDVSLSDAGDLVSAGTHVIVEFVIHEPVPAENPPAKQKGAKR